MSDPISGGGGAALKIAMQQLQQMQQTKPPVAQPGQQGGGVSSFQKTMQNHQTNQAQKVNQVNDVQKANQAGKTRSIRNIAQSQKVQATQKTDATRMNKLNNTKSNAPKGLSRMMEGLSNRKKDMDKLIKQVLAGKKGFNQKELLVLQYKVSTFSMEMDLTSKVVEKSTGGVKQAMNTQV
ncbi:MAG TPA: hypothetical protein DCE42_29020 [Myxococcales bacterium]|nr:hypothetical protein [Deltaproteobacteria bacterium]HAA58840.1 hypothetical protein [Myxococcales bacterium]|tara:strand:+ start:10493 stop:11032 length:540 start_codon:yes stop_codon:yes gene_type:complete